MQRFNSQALVLVAATGIILHYLHLIHRSRKMNRQPSTTTATADASASKGKDGILFDNNSETSSLAPMQLFLRESDPIPPKTNDTIRLVFLSDTHGRHEEIPLPLPDGDVLFHLGDATNRGNITQMCSFVQWMKKNSQHKERYVIDGNHDRDRELKGSHPTRDFMAEYENEDVAKVLRNEVVKIAGGKMTVLGVTWDAYQSRNYSEAESNLQTWRESTSEGSVDLVLSHAPPYPLRGGSAWHGSRRLNHFMRDLHAPLHCFGHIHYGRGVRAYNSEIMLVNCATAPSMKPVVIDYCPNAKRVMSVHCPVSEHSLESHLHSKHVPKEWIAGDAMKDFLVPMDLA